jgi:hypothetical protein
VESLNHPNICTLDDVGRDYAVMEHVEGETPKGPLPLDAVAPKTTGAPEPVAERVDAPFGKFAEDEFSVSQAGTLIYRSGRASGVTQLTWFDYSGKALGTVGSPGVMQTLSLSPDGHEDRGGRATGRQSAESNVWLCDLTHGTSLRSRQRQGSKGFPSGLGTALRSRIPGNRAGFAALLQKVRQRRLSGRTAGQDRGLETCRD